MRISKKLCSIENLREKATFLKFTVDRGVKI
jgi:hypothetical protein